MFKCTQASAMIFSIAVLCAGPASAAKEPVLLKDLTSVIMLLGLPCEEVVSAKQQAENEHIALCRNGDRYRVYVNPEGRVVAQKQ
ncbi:MAG: hypothetical protein ACSLFJ_02390 [Immundisolibacter sp.]|uniref:hypothetical protein n=1 Tax=Immundisolibacter sp. TaxID=1934948 RepID=UPI003EDE8669